MYLCTSLWLWVLYCLYTRSHGLLNHSVCSTIAGFAFTSTCIFYTSHVVLLRQTASVCGISLAKCIAKMLEFLQCLYSVQTVLQSCQDRLWFQSMVLVYTQCPVVAVLDHIAITYLCLCNPLPCLPALPPLPSLPPLPCLAIYQLATIIRCLPASLPCNIYVVYQHDNPDDVMPIQVTYRATRLYNGLSLSFSLSLPPYSWASRWGWRRSNKN